MQSVMDLLVVDWLDEAGDNFISDGNLFEDEGDNCLVSDISTSMLSYEELNAQLHRRTIENEELKLELKLHKKNFQLFSREYNEYKKKIAKCKHRYEERMTEMESAFAKSQTQNLELKKQIHFLHAERQLTEEINARTIDVIFEGSQLQFEHVVRSYEELLREVYKACELHIRQWKCDYEKSKTANGDLEVTERSSELNVKHIWSLFQAMEAGHKVLILIGIGILVLVCGFTCWHFVVWAWPILIKFAMITTLPGWITSTVNFLSSDACACLVKAWNNCEPLNADLIKKFGMTLLPNIVRMAPEFLKLIKSATKRL